MSHSLKSLISYDADSDDDDDAGDLEEATTSHPGSSTSTPAKTRRVLVRKKPKPIPLVAYAHEEDEDQEKEVEKVRKNEEISKRFPHPSSGFGVGRRIARADVPVTARRLGEVDRPAPIEFLVDTCATTCRTSRGADRQVLARTTAKNRQSLKKETRPRALSQR